MSRLGTSPDGTGETRTDLAGHGWIKGTPGSRHRLAETRREVTIKVCLALIAAVPLQLQVGRRPNRRMMERIQLYPSGIARLDEREGLLAEELARLRRAKDRAVRAEPCPEETGCPQTPRRRARTGRNAALF